MCCSSDGKNKADFNFLKTRVTKNNLVQFVTNSITTSLHAELLAKKFSAADSHN